MKTTVKALFVVCLTLFSFSVMAQTKQQATPESIAKGFTDKMTKALSLTADQVPKVQTINEDYTKKGLDLYKQYGNSKSELTEKLKVNNADREVALRKVFTEKQYNTYLEKKSEWQVKGQEAAKKAVEKVAVPPVPPTPVAK